jgi:polyisoprenoid-binding protein YceI
MLRPYAKEGSRMCRHRVTLAGLTAVIALSFQFVAWSGGSAATPAGTTYSVHSDKSKMEIHVSKEGAFKAFGHDHLVAAKDISGEVDFDSQQIEASKVRLRVATKSLTVVDPGESEKDRKAVQQTMEGPQVLDVAKFPEIAFTSTSISAAKKTPDGWEVTLAGKLNLHGAEKPISFPLHVSAAGDELHAQGEVSLLQTDYGITPVKVAGGTVKVKDRLKITFAIGASKRP